MTGLEIEIRKRKRVRNTNISFVNAAEVLHTNYNRAKRKIVNGTLTVSEALKIFDSLNFIYKDQFEAFKYLFTEQGD